MNQNQSNTKNVVFLDTARRQPRQMATKSSRVPTRHSAGNFKTWAAIGMSCILILFFSIQYYQIRQQHAQTMDRLNEVKQIETQLVKENAEIQREYQLIQDPEYLAQVARRDYYYSKPGEIIFKIDEN